MRCQQSADTATNDFMVISHKNTERHKNTSIGNLTANGFVQNLCYTRKKNFRPIQTVYISIHQLPIGLAIDVDANNGSLLVSFLHGDNQFALLFLRDGMAENYQINVARDKNLKGFPTCEARHDRITGAVQKASP